MVEVKESGTVEDEPGDYSHGRLVGLRERVVPLKEPNRQGEISFKVWTIVLDLGDTKRYIDFNNLDAAKDALGDHKVEDAVWVRRSEVVRSGRVFHQGGGGDQGQTGGGWVDW